MTESKAIEVMKWYSEEEYGKGLVSESHSMAIKALEKQIPKKPYCIEDKMWGCPVCDNHLLPKWVKYPTELMPKTAGLPHCMSCGQKIDWSE